MDDYEKKFAEMQKYIPFLEAMIERLQKVTDKSREVQLLKMQQLHGILSDSKRKLKIETLQKCEDVLQKLHNKVEKGTSAGMNFPNNKKTSESTLSKNICVKTMDNNIKIPKKLEMESPKIEETPASPSPPASPDDQLKSISSPIIIPTERKHDDLYDKSGNKPASPDQSETVCTKEPVIIPTERTDDSLNYSPENFSSISSSQDNDYDFRNPSYTSNIKTHKRPIPTIPVSPRARRISSSIEKLPSSSGTLDRESECLKSDGSKQIEMKSPECRSPRSFKEHLQSPSKLSKVPASLLVSPLRVSSEPPLSMEDLAELLNDGSNINSKKDDTTQGTKSLNPSKSEKSPKLKNKSSNDNDDSAATTSITTATSTTTVATTSISTNAPDNPNNDDDENSSCKPFVLTQEDIDREIDRRWETIDKPIIKFKRKPLNNGKAPLLPQNHSLQEQSSLENCKKTVEIRDSPMSPVGSDRGSEPRYADNYERIPRNQKTERHSNNIDVIPQHSQIPDMSVINSAFSRLSEGDKANLAKLQTNLPKLHSKSENFPPPVDDRELYQRRVKPCQMEMIAPGRLGLEQDYRRDNTDYFMQRPRHHPCNREYSNQWIPGGGGHSNQLYEHNHQQISPNNYPHPQNGPHHPDRWNMGPNAGPGCGIPMERSDHHMSPQPGPNGNRGRPMMSPTGRPDGNHGPYMDGNFPEEIPYPPQIPPLIPPLMSTGPFNPPPPPPPLPPHRMPYPPENRLPYESPFEHPGDFVPPPIRPQWEPSPLPHNGDIHYHDNSRGRGAEVPFHPQMPQAAVIPPPPPPPSWNRGHMGEMHPIRNRSNERFPLERMGKSPHSDPQYSGFNRRNDWDRALLQNENNQKFNRETRNISERDPRFRKDLSPQEPNHSPNASITKRDPRLSKEPVQTSTESKSKGISTAITNRDPRKRISESKEQTKVIINTTKSTRNQNKSKALTKKKELLKADIKSRRNSEDKGSPDKALKDIEKMQSPLESLYGVIDTAAKTGKGYGLQKFRIPKIKRPDPPPRAPTPPKVPESISNDSSTSVELINEEIQVNIRQEEKKMEVSSTTDETALIPTDSDSCNQHKDEKQVSEAAVSVASENSDKRDVSEAIVDTSTPGKCSDTQSKTMTIEIEEGREAAPQFKDEITREWIEKMIKNSLEQGEGKKLLEQAKLLKKLGEGLAHSKKFKKIRKIIESQSESSSSSDNEEIIVKKKTLKKKKRLIVSESSDDNNEEAKNDDAGDNNDEAADDDDEEHSKKDSNESIATDVRENDSPDKLQVESKTKRTTPGKNDEENSSKDSKVVETEASEPQQEVKSPVPKPKRKPARRRNSLEMLQEDIREMFISEGVVTATGHRMCRLLKKTDGNLASADDKVKSQMYISSSPERHNETGSEEGERLPVRRKRTMNKTLKSHESNTDMKLRGRRTRKRPIRTVSKQYLSSSDSDEDGCMNTIITRGSLSRNESPEHQKDSNESHKSKLESENLLNLRRSGRVSMREPRVMIEKTDLGKIDSSKIMFDTSSDESFGIDVSELTAAVDISLHSDRQKPSQVEVSVNLDMEEEKEMDVDKKKLKEVDSSAIMKIKDDQASKASGDCVLNEPKVVDVTASEGPDDANKMALDASASSSNAPSVRKMNNSPSQLDRNEELIEDIIGDFVNDNNKDDENSCKLPMNKEDDMEDNKAVEAETIVTKKQLPLVKRKKKRNTWQMGILSKSKKRARKKKMTRSINATSSVSNKKPLNNPSNNSESLENVVEQADKVEEDKVNKLNSKESEKSLSEEVKKDNQQKIKMKTEKFIDYAWKGHERYPCLICNFNGKNIVQHYKTVHTKDEMMISRLTLLDAKRAINEAKDEAFLKLSEKVNKGSNRKYTCRFCVFTVEGEKVSAMETFYEHCTTHTGEYRFKCRSCNFQTTTATSIRGHYYKLCRKNYENLTLAVIEEPVPDQELIYGYLCSACNFIQLKEDNVRKHIENYHGNDNSLVEIIKVNMSSYFDVKENVEDSDSDDEIQADDVIGNDSDASSGIESNKYTEDIQEKNKEEREEMTKSPVNNDKIEDNDKIEETRKDENDDLLPIKSEIPCNNEGDSLVEKKKLSAFVCPPELENKEVEIQRERQKTMQELLKNYGTKFKNTSSGKGPSITDKLKDKMTINHSDESETFLNLKCNENIVDEPESEESPVSDENEVNQRAIDKEESGKSIFQNCVRLSPSISNVGTIENIECPEMEIAVLDDKSDKKLKDPLMSLEEETIKDSNSTEETSDGEVQLNTPYEESDTSDDESDCELPTDVNTLLKETINTTTNVPMITTIQRLAAQLQASKTVTNSLETGKNQFNVDSPLKPIVVPISDLRNFIEKQKLLDSKFPESSDTDNDRSNTPKNFIRLRRLSGDKLSCGTLKTEILVASKPNANESNKSVKILENKITEDCSFLKIENVISLAPNASSECESPLIDDIRKAVATTPVKNVGVSVLKKSSPNILKKIRAPIGKIDGILSRFQAIAPNPNTKFIIQPLSKPVSTVTTITTTTTATSTTVATGTITTISSSQSSPSSSSVKSILTAVTKPTNLKPQKTILTTSKSVVTVPVSKNTGQSKKIIAKPSPTTSQISSGQNKNGKNYKILKVFRPTVGGSSKAKDTSTSIVTQKKKTFEAFTAMLQASKLRHLYKCMGRTCTFTTDSVEAFGQHFEAHAQKIIADRNSSSSDGKRDCAPYGFKKCAYCYVSHDTWDELNSHYKKKHSFCAYQCGYCFYRGFTQSYVDLHQSSSHPGKPSSVILGIRDHHPVEIIDRRENVHPFVCKHECNKLFYVPEAFIAHLKMKHGATLSIFKCHMCPASALKAETLISHYKMHGIYKYQCLYCLFGADAPMELHHHLSLMHCNRPPKILERSLPISPVRDKDVLLQLIIRNLDDTFKCSELKTVTEIPSVNDEIITKKMGKEINIITPESIKSPEIPSNKTLINNRHPLRIVDPAEIIDLLDGQSLSINNKNSSNPGNFEESKKIIPLSAQNFNSNGEARTMLKLPDGAIVEKKPMPSSITKTNYSQLDNTDLANEQLVHQEPELVLRYANERVQIQIANAVDPLRIPDNLNMNDEFVNINVLDNPEFLKTAEQKAFEKFNEKSKSPNSGSNDNSEEKNNDSDIEIIECIEPSTAKPKKQLTPIKESLKPFLMLKEEKEGREASEKINQTIINTRNENSNSCIELSGSTEVSAPSSELDDDKYARKKEDDIKNNDNDDDEVIDEDNATVAITTSSATDNPITTAADNKDNEISEKPLLTLEDIKHTGFAGKDLYKCANEPCTFQSMTPSELRAHINGCPHNNGQIVNLKCIHCSKKFVKTGNLIDHLKIHGLKRFGCSLCNMRYALACQAVAHMRAKHKITSHKLVPADPTNPSPDALFVVQPLSPGERKGKKISKQKSFDSSLTNKVKAVAYGPNEIGHLPRQAIYNREVRCAVCPYTTKVRTNIIRHLQLHAKDETVPESGPVNPVPCLDKKEKMFDKMVNLASSSHQNGRMGAKFKETPADPEDESLPKFIPEKQRYVCCIADCNCLTINEDLLRCHIKALHPEETFFRCPHCPPPGQDTQSISIDKLGVHLKMHDTRLYKCSHCNHHHYHRHVVERHLADKHPEKRPFVKVIREIENTEIFEKPQIEETESETLADPDGNHWKCNVCEYKCVYKTDMVAHASTNHDERAQFKCTICPYKTSGKINFEQHIISKHINEPEADYTMVYERIKGIKKTPESVSEPIAIDEPFDTTPLWRRDMPRIRHIRGILLEEENEKKKVTGESPAKSGKRKSDVEPSPKPAKIKPKSISLDATTSGIIVEKGKASGDGGLKKSGKVLTNAELEEMFGPYGSPSGNMYTCTICSTYSSKYRQDIRDHLYMELKYWRWHCKDCGHLAVSHSRMLKHEHKLHRDKKPVTVELEEKEDIEKWVLNLMNTQRAIMRGEIEDPINAASIKSKTLPTSNRISPPTITLEDDSGCQIIPSSSFNPTNEVSKTVDLTSAITKFSASNDYEDDEDDDDNALIIDSKVLDECAKELLVEDSTEITSKKDSETKTYICKHCNVEFTGLRGFKIHVQINHLKRLAFICPYCDRSTNSETMMRQHIRGKHQGKPETIIKNPSAKAPELTNEFWEREYGIVVPKKMKKRKRKFDDDNSNLTIQNNEKSLELTDICVKCGFTAINSTGLKAHMRAHAKKHSLKCGYCSFTANSQTDIWQHSEINHPESDWRAEPIDSQNSSNDPPIEYVKRKFFEDYDEDIEEETTPVSEESQKKVIYSCFYCASVRSISLSTIRSHWNQYHKNLNERSVYKTGVPFKFTENVANIVDSPRLMKCGYCPKKGSQVGLRTHGAKKHPNLPFRMVEAFDTTQDIWICKWCNERVEGGMKKTSHHNMFHSHLPIRFKREQEAMVKQKGYICPECPFISVTLSRMRSHIAKHADVFQCKRCTKTFSTLQVATQHTINDHSGLAAAIERLPINIELMMAKVTQSDMTYIPEEEPQIIPSNDIFRNLGVARKSTTKQLVRKPSTSSRAVARKSTNPLPRYPPGFKFDINELSDIDPVNSTESSGWSYYGRPPTPVDYDNLNTVMVLGAAKMRVKCTKLAKLMNIDARVVLEDCKKVKMT